MRSIILYIFLSLIFSCKEKKDKIITHDDIVPVPSGDSTSVQNNETKTLYIERAHFGLKNFSITIKTKFVIPNTLEYDSSFYFEGIFLFIHDKNNNKWDSLKLNIDHYDPSDLAIEDFSDSLHFKTLLLSVNWTGDSDQPGSEFVEYGGQALNSLFTIDNLVSLERKDEWTLSGFVSGRDEVVSSGQSDYPLTISLKDYEIHVTDPDKQSIGYTTVALANIKAYRDPRLNEKSAYIIKKGKELIVDSIFRSKKLVRLIVADSIILYGRPEKISDNVEHNNAG